MDSGETDSLIFDGSSVGSTGGPELRQVGVEFHFSRGNHLQTGAQQDGFELRGVNGAAISDMETHLENNDQT